MVVACVASIDPDGAVALARARAPLAQYLSIPALATPFEKSRWASSVAALQAAAPSHSGRPDLSALAVHVPKQLVDEVAIVGTLDEARDKLTQRRVELEQRGIDEVGLQMAAFGGSDAELLGQVELLGACSDFVGEFVDLLG